MFLSVIKEDESMRILTDVSKAELDYLTNQPTAKAMIDKVKTEGKYIPEGDVAGAAAFVASRKQGRQEDALSISDEGRAALKHDNEAKAKTTTTDTDAVDNEIERLKERKAKLEQELQTADESKRQLLEAELNQVNAELMLKNTESYRRDHSSVY